MCANTKKINAIIDGMRPAVAKGVDDAKIISHSSRKNGSPDSLTAVFVYFKAQKLTFNSVT